MLTVYSKPNCPQCDFLKRLLERRGMPFTSIDIEKDEEAFAKVKATGLRSMPIVQYGDSFASGSKVGDPNLLDIMRRYREHLEVQSSFPSM